MSLKEFHLQHGATLAPDNIPLDYGNPIAEASHAQQHALLLDRSHEGRFFVAGVSRLEVINRISTNKVDLLPTQQGKPTLFTNANARILDRIEVYPYSEETLVIAGAGRGQFVQEYLQRNIFFNDKASSRSLMPTHHQFSLHGATAESIITCLLPDAPQMPLYGCASLAWQGATYFVFKRKPVLGTHWAIIAPTESAVTLAQHLLEIGKEDGLRLGGSMAYNILRVKAGLPANGELNSDFIPLELGLWDEVSFNKGCYTGQEIIARMDSREKLARVLVSLKVSQKFPIPTTLHTPEGQNVGTITSCASAGEGDIVAMAVVKTSASQEGTELFGRVNDTLTSVSVGQLLGNYPQWVHEN